MESNQEGEGRGLSMKNPGYAPSRYQHYQQQQLEEKQQKQQLQAANNERSEERKSVECAVDDRSRGLDVSLYRVRPRDSYCRPVTQRRRPVRRKTSTTNGQLTKIYCSRRTSCRQSVPLDVVALPMAFSGVNPNLF